MILQRLRLLFGTPPNATRAQRDEQLALLRARADYHAHEHQRIKRQITEIMSEPTLAKMREAGL